MASIQARLRLYLDTAQPCRIYGYPILYCPNLNPRSAKGETPLFLAAREGRLDVVKYLTRKGANKTVPDVLGRSPAWISASRGQAGAPIRWTFLRTLKLVQKFAEKLAQGQDSWMS